MDAIGPWKVDKSSLLSLNDCFEDQKTIYLQTIFLNQNDLKKNGSFLFTVSQKISETKYKPIKNFFFFY